MSNIIGAFTIAATGVNITTSGTSARTALPTMSSGENPRYVRVSATVSARVRLGTVTSNAVATDLLVMPSDAVILCVASGLTHVCAIQDTGAGTVAVSALEDM